MKTSATVTSLASTLALGLAIACGGSKSASSSPTSPTLSTPVASTTVTITTSGVSPNNIELTLGQRVLFVNNDSRSHNMTSDPHPEHTDCPPINSAGLLAPGRSIETGNFTTARVCNYHDHDSPTDTRWQGRITIK